MGVTGLWKLIEPCGKPVPVETLEGKVLAVDISIWLHQVVKGFQDSKGSALNNAHLLGLFHRLCKLLYYRVRPVFIFDGCTPQLKRDTIARRQQQRSKLSNEADRIQALLLQSLAKEKVVQQALGTNAELLLKSPAKRPAVVNAGKNDEDDIFKLPDLPAAGTTHHSEADSEMEDQEFTSTTSDSSFDESTARHSYNASLQAIDVRSQHFKNLPADVRHEILTDIKETRKQSSWGRLHELPARSDDFCSFQMKRLLKRRAVQESLEEAEQEMGGHTLTYSELSEFFSEEGIVTPTAIEESTRQISSDEHTRFLLVRDLKKKSLEETQRRTQIKFETVKEEDETDEKPCSSSKVAKLPAESIGGHKNELGEEYDTDLELALALSLEETGKVYDEKDYDYDSDQDLRLNREQSKQLRHAAKGPARSYMIEYGGMNDEEVENIMETTQQHNDKFAQSDMADISIEEAKQISLAIEESKKDLVRSEEVQTIDSDTDSDLEEVVDADEPLKKKSIQISVDLLKQLETDNDIFADIFHSEKELLNKTNSSNTEIATSKGRETVADKIVEVNENKSQEILKTQNKQLNEECTERKTKEKSADKIIPIADSDEQVLSNKDSYKPSISQMALNIKSVGPPVPLDSILNELKKQTEEVKNIKLDIKEEKEDKPEPNTILDELKKQTSEVTKIIEESIKSNSVIELSSDDEASKVRKPASDVIELCDSDNEKQQTISPNKTPSKNTSITDYFETSYKIKRTPDKACDGKASTPPTTPKVTQPFYVKRTPKSGRKHAGSEHSDEGPSPKKKSSKAAKSLFEAKEPEEPKPINSEEVIQNAANTLKAQNTTEELRNIASNLAQERRDLESERNRQDRMGMSISQRMSNECQELLRLFGMPYIVAPMEAEAQCAFLNAIDLTNGTITDDSDIWLFGGRTVYKNFFAQNKHVLEYRSEQIEKTFNCNRGKLIQLACLVGSDYTTGIHGVGTVTALEILASFSSSQQLDSNASAVLSTLVKFRDWWQAHKTSNLPIGSSARLALLKKLKNIDLHEGFPSISVIEAYMTPKVDDNRDSFSWGSPDVESIREFTRKSFGWTTSKTDDILMPVIKKINEKKIQGSIRNYFTSKSALKVQQPQVSKRVQKAIDKMSGGVEEETSENPKRVVRRTRNKPMEAEADKALVSRPKRGKRKAAATTVKDSVEEASTSIAAPKPAKTARIPNTREIIPQRERDLEQMRQNKLKAAEVLKASGEAKSFK